MKLYRVHIDRVLYVMASDALEAENIAIHEQPNMDETVTDVEPATPHGVQGDGWENYPPYGQWGTPLKAGEIMKKAKV
jgi:hypothetical protein